MSRRLATLIGLAFLPVARAFRMPSTHRLTELHALTGLRGFAALWVLLYHAWGYSGTPLLQLPGTTAPIARLEWFLACGWAGVDIFFGLSAFLLALPYAQWQRGQRARPATGRYLARRCLRILPAYYAQLAILLALAWGFGIGEKIGFGAIVAHLFLWLNLGFHPVRVLIGPYWTLPVEFAFYLVLPFIAHMLTRRRWPLLLIGAIVITQFFRWGPALAYADSQFRWLAIETMPGRLDQFVIGALAGYAFVVMRQRGWSPSNGLSVITQLLGIAGISVLCWAIVVNAATYWDFNPLLFIWHGAFALCLVPVLLACAFSAPLLGRLFDTRPLHYLGRISFGVYLWNMPIMYCALRLLPSSMHGPAKFWTLLALMLAGTIAVSHLSFAWIERPFLRLGHSASAKPGFQTDLAKTARV
ncbi:MAG: acyltransferase [Rhodanobacteraceae bacterium]